MASGTAVQRATAAPVHYPRSHGVQTSHTRTGWYSQRLLFTGLAVLYLGHHLLSDDTALLCLESPLSLAHATSRPAPDFSWSGSVCVVHLQRSGREQKHRFPPLPRDCLLSFGHARLADCIAYAASALPQATRRRCSASRW